jgi:DNA-binding transcriptional LysR family regulator
LEDDLGLSLFERDHSGIRLTPGGRSILRCVRTLWLQIDEIKRIGRQFASGSSGELRLGVRIPPIGGAFRALLGHWRETYPDVTLTLVEANERELALGLAEHRLDAAVVGGRTTWPHTAAIPLFREQMVAAVPSANPLASKPELDWSALSVHTILVQGGEDSHTQREYYATLLGNGARFQTHNASKQTIMGLVGAGAGVTLAPESQAEATFPGVTFKHILEENAWLEFDLVWLPDAEDPLLGRFVAFMRDESRTRNMV